MIREKIDITESLEWRYATKKFDPNAKIPEYQLNTLLNSVRLSPSSMGLQPYHFIRVVNASVRAELRRYSHNQSQITEASELIVFTAMKSIGENEIREFVERNAKIRKKDPESVQRQIGKLTRFIDKFEGESLFDWTSRQAYIAKGILLASAAQLKIDACPMEGIEVVEYDRILGLEALNLGTISVVTLGYRSTEDTYQWEPKVRKPLEDLISMI